MLVPTDTLEEVVALLAEYTRLENFRYCARWSRCTVVGVFADVLQSMLRWLRTRSAFVYNVNLWRYVCEYERRLERCCEQRNSMRGVLEETFEVLGTVYNIFDVARSICVCVKGLIQQRWWKLPNSSWPSKHVAVPRLAFHELHR